MASLIQGISPAMVSVLKAPALSPQASELATKMRDATAQARQVADSIRFNMAAQRKGHSSQTIERLKKQISDLTLMAATNPKAVARLIRGMARELAAATEDYARAGGPRDLSASPAATTVDPAAATPAAGADADHATMRAAYQAAAATAASHAPDEKFAKDAERIHERLTQLLKATLEAARQQDKIDGKDGRRERDELRRAYVKNAEITQASIATIRSWSLEPAPLPTLAGPVSILA
jgi:hypothetical protein